MTKKDFYKNKVWLRKRYITDGKKLEEIAAECGVSTTTIYKWLVEFQLIRNARKWS